MWKRKILLTFGFAIWSSHFLCYKFHGTKSRVFHRRLLNLDFIVAIYQKIVSASISQAVLCFFYEALAERFILRLFRVRVDSKRKKVRWENTKNLSRKIYLIIKLWLMCSTRPLLNHHRRCNGFIFNRQRFNFSTKDNFEKIFQMRAWATPGNWSWTFGFLIPQ